MAGGAGGFYQDEDAAMIADINVTPLVDVVLVLLIIFMVTAGVIAERGIPLEKPKTVSGATVKNTLSVAIDENRELYVDGVKFADHRAAQNTIAVKHTENPDIKAVISADVSVPHGDVMEVIDLVTLAGISKFALASKPKADTEKKP